NFCDLFASTNRPADNQAIKRVVTKVAIESEEFNTAARFVPQDDRWPVIQGRIVVAKRMDCAIQRRLDWTAGRHEQIDAEMFRSPFQSVVRRRREQRTCVKATWFVVSPNPHFRAEIFESAKYLRGDARNVCSFIVGSNFQTADTEVEND